MSSATSETPSGKGRIGEGGGGWLGVLGFQFPYHPLNEAKPSFTDIDHYSLYTYRTLHLTQVTVTHVSITLSLSSVTRESKYLLSLVLLLKSYHNFSQSIVEYYFYKAKI